MPVRMAITEMQAHGVEFHLCGQSAAAYKLTNADLLPGVKMSLSAMTSHALSAAAGLYAQSVLARLRPADRRTMLDVLRTDEPRQPAEFRIQLFRNASSVHLIPGSDQS